MRKIRIFAHISLDGVIAPGEPDDNSEFSNGGWTVPYRSPAGAAALLEAQGASFDLLLGRRTYDLWAGFWPTAGNNPMADRINAATKYVATHRPQSLAWQPAASIGGDIAEGVRAIKASHGPDLMVCGSTALTSVLFEQGMVDDVVLIVYPVLLGRGKRFFSESIDPRALAFVSTTTTPTGVLLNHYRWVGPIPAQS
jgi:dihydrofolate reductase